MYGEMLQQPLWGALYNEALATPISVVIPGLRILGNTWIRFFIMWFLVLFHACYQIGPSKIACPFSHFFPALLPGLLWSVFIYLGNWTWADWVGHVYTRPYKHLQNYLH